MELQALTIHSAHELLKKKEISAVELTRAVLSRIETLDSGINAYLTIDDKGALMSAEKADKTIRQGNCSPLCGIPLALKDLICTQGLRTTCGSKILENFVPPYDAHVVQRLKGEQAVILGKLNMDEFAMGSSNEHSAFFHTRNPWDQTRIPGGSSGGSAAAVAADMCLGALGSDTGGSIRQPASHCGIVGMKPTYGRVSRFGLVAFASSLDQIGPLAKDVRDCALLMNTISGHDPSDSTSVPRDVPDYCSGLTGDLHGMKIGLPKEYFDTAGLSADVSSAIGKAVETFKSLGATCVEVTLPHTDYAVAAYYVIAPCEAGSNLARYDGVKYGFRDKSEHELMQMYKNTRSAGFGAEVQRRIIIGTYALSAGYYDAYYKKASQVRTLIVNDFKNAFEHCDLVLSPTAPTPAFKIGETVNDPLSMYLSDVFTLSANLAGVPGISVPCGFSTEGLPIGVQLMGPHFSESLLLKAAYCFEQAAGITGKKPDLA